ncbi:MAG: aspartate--tRNA ligase [Candidatus Kapabacteria bacterium]|nr:aspartate--tRNA ligase [Ignavibacteriota bacterium]MCW5884567.1 aspartate--tRNA ligase [Candidatus Kapabacteria bacterium]
MIFKKRSVNCGQLKTEDVDRKVVLNGWASTVRDLGGLIFVDVRDRFGITQAVFEPEKNPVLAEKAKDIKTEYVVWIEGTVRLRSNPNKNIPTGLIEVVAEDFAIINKADLPPFPIEDGIETSEEIKLKYRYLDLRRPELQRNFIIRNQLYQIVHRYYNENNFLEVETPVLMKSTPEGARDFLVPSRINKGKFYALPQSPQIFKQILMMSGFDRYMQIVKCFRDEDLRSDRQPEFTQVDVEMSFIDREDILEVTEKLFARVWKEVLNIDIELPIRRMSYETAMNNYGSDKPDLRFDMKISHLNDGLKSCDFKVFKDIIESNGLIGAICVKGGAELSRKHLDELTEFAKKYGAKGLAWIKYIDGDINSPIAKFLTDEEKDFIRQTCGAENGDLILISSDKKNRALTILGALRLEVASRIGILDKVKGKYEFLWVLDFPLFEYDDETGRYYAMHHPFTSPMEEDLHLLDTDPSKVRAKAYDIVCNGAEIGGGSIRIHDNQVQKVMFDKLGLSESEIEEKFGFLIKALKFGAPPHGGIALGLDRMVMILAGTDNIRDVIAFPKTTSGLSLMDGSPSEVDISQLNELGVDLIKKNN